MELERKSFKHAVVLGKNWRYYPADGERAPLSIDSKLSALAAGDLLANGVAGIVIFSGGRTAGANHSSEAEAMRDYLLRHDKRIKPCQILLEEGSIDTRENAEGVRGILNGEDKEECVLVSVGYHLPRARRIFESYGMNFSSMSSEDVLKDYRRKNNEERNKESEFAESYAYSLRRIFEWAKEFFALRLIQRIDKRGRMLNYVARKVRG